MKKNITIVFAVLLVIALCAQGAMAESLVGKWSGTVRISTLPFGLPATVTFEEGGRCTISVLGMSAAGSYEVRDDSLLVTPDAIEGIGTTSLTMELADGKLSVSGSIDGVDGSFSGKKKG
ncbi:hypothetical protein LJC74_04185 [Eubacteriales bacterium OttesenSCG-928-A19]|nr:hypothetical protein [Eubacteriales bacterium OttesenSCG-928-A19]